MKKVLVLDFGGQYNLLVARRVRECGIYCEIKSYRMTMDEIRAFAPDALIFTGGPATVFEEGAPMVDPAIFELGVPVLGICYGLQLMIHLLGGECRRAETREYGKVELTHSGNSPLFDGVPEKAVYWMSHGVEVGALGPGLRGHRLHRGLRPRGGAVQGEEALRRAVPPRGAAHRSTAPTSCKTFCIRSAASPRSGRWRRIWRRPWRTAAAEVGSGKVLLRALRRRGQLRRGRAAASARSATSSPASSSTTACCARMRATWSSAS